MKILIPKERRAGESRVAATPETVKRLIKDGFDLRIEAGAGEDSYLVRLIPLRRVLIAARASAIEITLDIRLREVHSWRAAIHDAAKRQPVAFTKGRYDERFSKTVTGHFVIT